LSYGVVAGRNLTPQGATHFLLLSDLSVMKIMSKTESPFQVQGSTATDIFVYISFAFSIYVVQETEAGFRLGFAPRPFLSLPGR
jgi:hypothetical protein